jgi:hypothetical protein
VPVALIYFFINSLALPFGLTFTALLSPYLYVWVVMTRKQEVLWPFLLVLTPFVLIQISQGVDLKSYCVSLLNITSVYIFCQTFYTWLLISESTETIFKKLVVLNCICCLLAIPVYFTDFYDVVWMDQFLTEGVEHFRRLRLFTYEPSYYALLFTPLFCFFLLQIIFMQNTMNAWLLLLMLFLPFILSFALGVIMALIMAGAITYLVHFRKLSRNKRVLQLITVASIIAGLAIFTVVIFFPDNVLFIRLGNVLAGKDPSAKGRTIEAFWLAGQLLDQKSYWWGIGAGQIKIFGFELIRDYYRYGLDTTQVAIPNAAAETLAIFGWVGLIVRLLVEGWLFLYTRVWMNYYRLLLFVFIFIYKFTGSFITNVAEYVIWILAFTHVFPQFDRVQKTPDTITSPPVYRRRSVSAA